MSQYYGNINASEVYVPGRLYPRSRRRLEHRQPWSRACTDRENQFNDTLLSITILVCDVYAAALDLSYVLVVVILCVVRYVLG